MKTSALFLACAASPVLAHPGMDRVIAEIQARDDFVLNARSTSLLGDLVNGVLTAVGQTISNILTQATSAIAPGTSAAYKPPGALGSPACTKDPLCVWYYVATDMWGDFADANGCTDLGRGAIRLGFHDAAAWDVSSSYGGADGSILLTDELSRSENRGLEEIGAQTKTYYTTYHPYGAGMADIIQLGALVGTVACPGGPRIRAFAGRKDNPVAAPPGKLPLPSMDAPTLISLFSKKTFTASDLVALVGAHTAARQRFVDPSRAGAALDSDPQIWDASFYAETLTGNNKTFFILHSDKALATYSTTKAQWKTFAGSTGQALWSPAYAQAYFRMSLLGVNNLNQLTEITKVLPSR
ncbi:peroxidase [Xylaria bambusicola]|uniref:peroxidase n=1 Tax=Xylaria bambusicola TaxID=326684 RepID=UPI00200783E1|nr:peroxidase [Xylaria bambusicola]KAI0505216.1 peroxidase [Xylaria bambusicola]